MISFLESFDLATGQREVLRMFSRIIEAPIWLPDGDTLLYSSLGRLWLYSISKDEETLLDTGTCRGCVNDYVFSRDGKTLYFNNVPLAPNDWSSFINVMPLDGSQPPRLLIPETPSYAHSISAAGDLYFSGNRKYCSPGDMDVYVLPAGCTTPVRLTDGVGYNDAPDVSPDGESVWFCSTRGGDGMQLWAMDPDGANLRQITHTERDCWYPHFSPDGRTVIYLSVPHQVHPNNSELIYVDACIRAMDPDGGSDRLLFRSDGAQCTINSSSWSPDSRRFAFVSYRD